MGAQPRDQHTYVPSSEDELADVLSFIDAHERARGARPEPRYFLSGPDQGDQVELPEQAYRALTQILTALAAGKAVTVAPQSQVLTTQQAADLLGVSRPTVVQLIEDGQLPAHTPGRRRRLIRLDDVLAYRDRRREAQYQALLEMAVEDYDDEDDPEARAEELRSIRADVAARRRRARA